MCAGSRRACASSRPSRTFTWTTFSSRICQSTSEGASTRLDSTRSLLSTRSNLPQVSLFLKNYGGIIIIIILSSRIYHFTIIIKCHKCAVAASFVTRLLQQPFNSVHLKDWTWHPSGQYCTPVDSLALLCTRSALRSLFCLETRVNVDFHDPPQRQRLVNSIRVLFLYECINAHIVCG